MTSVLGDALHELAMASVVTGGMIHDARIAACCIVSGITKVRKMVNAPAENAFRLGR